MSSIGVIRSSGWAAATRFSVAPRLECSLPIATIVSFQLRPTISLFKSATTFASGTVGCSEKNWLPHRPRSSPLTVMKASERLGGLEYGRRAGGVVVGTVADRVGPLRDAAFACPRGPDMVHVPGEKDILALERGVAPLEHADHVRRGGAGQLALLHQIGDGRREAAGGPAAGPCPQRRRVDAQGHGGRRVAD